jgi:O-antigen/teichoic acid export membrane protein
LEVDPPADVASPPADATGGGRRVVGIRRFGRLSVPRGDFSGKVLQTFTTELVLGAVGLVTGIVTARWLGPSGKGEFALVTVVVSLLYSLTGFGLPQAIVYYTKRVPAPDLTANALLLAGTVGGLSLVVGGTVVYFGLSGALDLERGLLLVALLSLPAVFVANAAAGVIHGRYQLAKYNLLRVVNPVAFLPLVAAAMLLPDRVEAAVVAWTVAQGVATVLYVVTALSGTGVARRHWAPDWAHWKALLRFGARTHIGNILKFFQYRFDVVLIGALLDKRQVGLYVVGLTLSELPLRVPDAVGLVLFPRVAATEADRREDSITPLAARHTVFLTFTLSAVLFAAAPWLITTLFGSRFRAAYVATWFLLPGGVALSLWKILAQDLIARGRPNAYSFSALCSLVVMVIGCAVLVPRYRLAGGGIASSAAYLTATAVLWVAYRRATGERLRNCVIMRRDDFARYVDGVAQVKARLRRSPR